ncbi:MAG: c-type cytochrome [Alphaproteobacteria bacterium]
MPLSCSWRDTRPLRRLAAAGAVVLVLSTPAAGQPVDGEAGEGKRIFAACRGCHEASPAGANRTGPNLWGVVGRSVGSASGFAYSSALKGLGGAWDASRLDRFIAAPAAEVPGTRMTYPGLKDAARRADVVAYLATLRNGAGAGDDPQDWQGLPEGDGRRDVFYTCQACHSLKLVQQQRLDRRAWTGVLAWMVSEKRMPEPTPEVGERLVDYLSTHYGAQKSATPGGLLPAISPLRP